MSLKRSIKKALLEAFSDESVSHKVLLNGSPLLEKNRQKRVRQAISRCFFEFDSANDELTNSDKKLVSKVAEYLRNTESEMLLNIEGYTCDIGSMEYNTKLSKKTCCGA